MLKTSLTSSGSQPGMVADEVDDEVGGGYSSSGNAGGGGSIENRLSPKNFKNPKAKNHRTHGRT